MYRMYAADPRARINVGIRRRLAPLLENDVARIKLMVSLLLSMRGSPTLYYGDEIGMGDNIYLGDRDGVRTPMQWRPERNAGFSRADPQRLYLPPVMDPIYGYEAVNVEAQNPGALVAAQLDTPAAGGALGVQRVRSRHAHVPEAGKPEDPRVPARVRGSAHPVRREPRALRAAGGARSRQVQGTGTCRADGAHGVSADRRSAVPADAGGPRLPLVPAAGGGGRPRMARGANPARGAADTGAVRRLGESLPGSRRAVAHRDVGESSHAAGARGAAGVRRAQPVVCGEGRAGEARGAGRSRRMEPLRPELACHARSGRARDGRGRNVFPAADAGVGRPRRRTDACARAVRRGEGAPAGAGGTARRCLR